MKEDIWDSRMPETLTDVVALLKRRLAVHEAWLSHILAGTEHAQKAVDAGVGTVESHNTYANQYTAAIVVLNNLEGIDHEV